MLKESTHRADELKELGWSGEDISRYIDLWDYRQRWGAINLEREDRLFLRKAEAVLPTISKNKASVKKPTREKSYYRRLFFFLEAMNQAENSFGLKVGERGAWAILLEEELRLLDYYAPVLGLPDSLKAKAFESFREEMISELKTNDSSKIRDMEFDFGLPLKELKAQEPTNWRPLRESASVDVHTYPILESDSVSYFRQLVRKAFSPLIKQTLPSLAETDKPEPPDDWSQN